LVVAIPTDVPRPASTKGSLTDDWPHHPQRVIHLGGFGVASGARRQMERR